MSGEIAAFKILNRLEWSHLALARLQRLSDGTGNARRSAMPA